MSKKKTGNEGCGTLTFEDSLKQLEVLVSSVETGQMPLQESLDAYERGNELIHHMRKLLEGAEKKIRILGADTSGADRAGEE